MIRPLLPTLRTAPAALFALAALLLAPGCGGGSANPQQAAVQAAVANVNCGNQAASGPQTVRFKTSAHCGACKQTIEGALNLVPGTQQAVLNLDDKVATATYDPAKTCPDQLRAAIEAVEYTADPLPQPAQ